MKFYKWIGWHTGLFLLVMFYSFTTLAAASQARIAHLVIKNSADALLVDLKIDSDFAPELKAALLQGVPVRFTISISLYEVNDLWFDKKVAAKNAVHELRYDGMRKAFKIARFPGRLQPTYIEDFDSARLIISAIDELVVIPLTELKKSQHYQLMVGTVLSKREISFFNFFQGFKTDRYTVNFIY